MDLRVKDIRKLNIFDTFVAVNTTNMNRKSPEKMKTIKLFITIVLIGVNLLKIYGDNSYVFHHLTTRDGLSNNSVKALLRDSRGFLWIGTEFGLNRYDGIGFKIFLANPGVVNKLPSNNIQGLSEDGSGNIWINMGYSYAVYNREKENFQTDIDELLSKYGIKKNNERKIHIDKNKNLVVVHTNEINYYNPLSGSLKIFKFPKLNLPSVEISDDIDNIYIIDNLSFLWQINKKTGRYKKIAQPINIGINNPYRHAKIFVEKEGSIWLFASNNNHAFYNEKNSSKWVQVFLKSQIKSQNTIMSIVEGHDNQIWITTDHLGLFVYDKKTRNLSNITSNSLSESSISSDNISGIFIDNSGTLWVGHDKKGISYFNKSFQNFTNIYPDKCKDISKIYELRNGNILLGTDGDGLFLKKDNSNALTKLPIPNTAIVSILEDSKGRVWIGTFQQGLFCFNNNILKHYTTANSNLTSDDIWSIEEDKYGDVWIGSLGGKIHIYKSNNTTNQFAAPFEEQRHVSDMIFDGRKSMYIATAYGLTLIDVEKQTSKLLLGNIKGTQLFNQPQITNMFKDSRNFLWLGTSGGLTIWDLRKDSLMYFDSSDGLCDNIVRGVTEDDFNNIWVTTSNGLSVITLDRTNSNKITNCRNFSTNDGLKTIYFNNNSICKLKNGNIFAGTTEGYTMIDPQKIVEINQPLSKVYFTKMTLGDTEILVDSVYNGHVVLKKSIEQVSSINLKHNDKLITFEFTTSDLINAEKIKYVYKIEGLTNQWIPTKKNEISITSLPPGRYILYIKACNSDGVWNNSSKMLMLNIEPPFYYSRWAMIAYILVFMGAILFLVYRGQRRHQIKMEEQRRQMAHEHELQINEMKLRFFTNISHDLRTPLTLIITPLQALLKDIGDENLKKKLEVMFKNAQQLLSLINSLLDFRKLDVGAEILHLKPGNIVDLINEIYSSFVVYADERKISLTINTSHDNLWIDYDHDKIQKSIINLLSNAFKYTPEGGSIEIILLSNESEVSISVLDTGTGISDEDKKMVFNRFYQTSHNLRKTGSGIGLHIASEYVKLHHGTIEILDNKPCGCIFTIRFPKIVAVSNQTLEENEDVEVLEDIKRDDVIQKKPVLLFVDDNQDLCEFIYDNLKDEYSVLIANDGQEAIVLLKQNDVNIIVSDIMMPVMDGIELCKQIKTNIEWSHIPVILLTARTTDEHKIEGLEIGADDYVTKPFNLDILKLRILKFFEWSLKSHKVFKQKLEVNPHEITITTLDEKLIEKAIDIVEKHISDTEFSVEMLGDALGLSRGHLYKKLIAITGKGPAEFIRTIRLKRGMQLLEKSQLQIAEIAYEVGFNSPKRFTINFKEEFGLSPSEYIKKVKLENNNLE